MTETSTRTIEVAIYPGGRRVPIRHQSALGWQWDRDRYSSHKDSARRNAREAGADIVREPNPNYRPRLATFERLTRGLL